MPRRPRLPLAACTVETPLGPVQFTQDYSSRYYRQERLIILCMDYIIYYF